MNEQRERVRRHLIILFTVLWLAKIVSGQCPTGTTGYNCIPCSTGCDVCDTDPTSCDTCTKGYYLNSTLCVACPLGCRVCSIPSVCTECNPGHDAVMNALGEQECHFKWQKWFLIIFGTLFGLFLLGLAIWCIRKKINDSNKDQQQIEYEMKKEHTEADINNEQ